MSETADEFTRWPQLQGFLTGPTPSPQPKNPSTAALSAQLPTALIEQIRLWPLRNRWYSAQRLGIDDPAIVLGSTEPTTEGTILTGQRLRWSVICLLTSAAASRCSICPLP
jgi:hypothetical protein